MTALTVVRYAGSVASVAFAAGLLTLAGLHAAAGVDAAAIPAVGGSVMLAGALSVAPETDYDFPVYVGSLVVAVASVAGFLFVGASG